MISVTPPTSHHRLEDIQGHPRVRLVRPIHDQICHRSQGSYRALRGLELAGPDPRGPLDPAYPRGLAILLYQREPTGALTSGFRTMVSATARISLAVHGLSAVR
jgi:hypothetical protein